METQAQQDTRLGNEAHTENQDRIISTTNNPDAKPASAQPGVISTTNNPNPDPAKPAPAQPIKARFKVTGVIQRVGGLTAVELTQTGGDSIGSDSALGVKPHLPTASFELDVNADAAKVLQLGLLFDAVIVPAS